jgi:hypothetical protein
MPEYPYAAYYVFFARWFGNIWFVTFAFLLWVVVTVHWAFMLKGKTLWLRVPLVFIVSAVHYLIFGLLIAGGRFGGEAEFLYDPALLRDNLFIHGGLQGILLWPLSLLPTGGIWIVLPVVIFGWVFWYVRSSRKRRPAE